MKQLTTIKNIIFVLLILVIILSLFKNTEGLTQYQENLKRLRLLHQQNRRKI